MHTNEGPLPGQSACTPDARLCCLCEDFGEMEPLALLRVGGARAPASYRRYAPLTCDCLESALHACSVLSSDSPTIMEAP